MHSHASRGASVGQERLTPRESGGFGPPARRIVYLAAMLRSSRWARSGLVVVALAVLGGCTTSTDLRGDASADAAHDATNLDATGTDASSDANGALDAGKNTGVACGTSGTTCASSTTCCEAAGGASCEASPGTCTGDTYLCDGPEDCTGGNVCCIVFDGGPGSRAGSSCLPSCVTGLVRYPACHDAGDCDVGDACCDSLGGPTTTSPYHVCIAGGGCPL